MPSTLTACQTLLTAIEGLVTAAAVCPVDQYQVTAGEPAQPASTTCTVVSVWASQYFNATSGLFHEDNPCLVVRGVQLNWRFDTCYPEQERDHTADEHLETADCLYGSADAIWCGLIPLLGGLFGRCEDSAVDPLTIDARLGGYVSASSAIRIQLDCTPTATPEDIVGEIAGVQGGQSFG